MNEKLMKSGSGLIGVLEKTRVALDPLSRRLLGRTVADEGSQPAGLADFEREAEELMSRQRTARAQRIVRSAVVVVCGLIVWAAFAEIDEVTKGDGRVIPSRQLQVVQSLDGGVVSEILVREGQQVEAGQLLLKIDETRATSGVNESAAQAFALQVKQARLKALAEGIAFRPPAGSGSPDENRIVDEERNLYQSKVYELESMISVVQQQAAQRQQEVSEAQARRASAQRSIDISTQELKRTRPLLASGAVSEVEVLRLERDISRFRGDAEQAAAQIGRAQAAIGEAQRKARETELTFRNEARRELSEVLGKLNALNQGAVALADKVDKAQLQQNVAAWSIVLNEVANASETLGIK